MCFHHESLDYNYVLSIFSIFSSLHPYFHIFKSIDQRFSIFERSLETFDQFISFSCPSSSFPSSLSLSRCKKYLKMSHDFNLSTFLLGDSTLSRHYSNL